MATTEHRVTTADPADASGPHQLWARHEYIKDSKLFREYCQRLVNGRDLHVIVTASSETGVGKTTLAVSLALLWDQHGWTADKAAVADAAEYSSKYDDEENVKPGSALILDEAEIAADSRRGTSKGNVAVSQAFAGKRYRQVFGLLTAPSKSWVDDRLGSSSADYWIQALEGEDGQIKGEARVYRLREQEHYETYYSTKTETISWPILDDNKAFRELDRIKRRRLSGDVESQYVHRDEVREIKENFWNKATQKTRYHLIKGMAEFGMSQKDIAEVLQISENVEGLTRQRVGQLVNTESFDEAYST